ncbi:MAG: cupin [Bacteroidetes bacterium]|nr:cupin [Bacteroidota bacterium]
MASVHIPDENRVITGFAEIKAFLQTINVWHDRWEANAPLAPESTQEEILDAYAHVLRPYMASHHYQVADVINVHGETPNLQALRDKFLAEHTHTEDEVRFFVDGQGYFWFNPGGGRPVCYVHCVAGDLLSVPANTPHWFDLGEPAFVKAIRIFIDPSGWVPHYTESGIDQQYRS